MNYSATTFKEQTISESTYTRLFSRLFSLDFWKKNKECTEWGELLVDVLTSVYKYTNI